MMELKRNENSCSVTTATVASSCHYNVPGPGLLCKPCEGGSGAFETVLMVLVVRMPNGMTTSPNCRAISEAHQPGSAHEQLGASCRFFFPLVLALQLFQAGHAPSADHLINGLECS